MAALVTFGGGGCASRRPAPVVVERQAVGALPTNPWEEGFKLRCVTFNIWGLPGWMTGAPSGRYPRIARELERLDPDIILLQEAWTSNARRSIPTNGDWAIARAAGQHTFFQQSGLVTLCKYPIIDGEFYPFTRAAFPDRFVNKGVLKVTVQMPNGRVLNIWNVHMQDGHATAIRGSQVRELIAHVQAAEDGQVADLVGGDFNCTPESPLCRELVRGLGPSLQQLGGGEPFITWDGLSKRPGKTGQMIDYIFIRERATLQDVQASQHVAFTTGKLDERLSDHLGIEAEVNLNPASSVAGALGPSVESAQLPGILAHRAP
jgi:endonuclease/exonuclease/phosphatase family metal-dependent hydrolase